MAADSLLRARRRARRSAASLGLVTRDEAFRTLRSNVLVATSDLSNPSIIVTSAVPGEGSPLPFYEKYGFERTGNVHDGEVELRLGLRRGGDADA